MRKFALSDLTKEEFDVFVDKYLEGFKRVVLSHWKGRRIDSYIPNIIFHEKLQ